MGAALVVGASACSTAVTARGDDATASAASPPDDATPAVVHDATDRPEASPDAPEASPGATPNAPDATPNAPDATLEAPDAAADVPLRPDDAEADAGPASSAGTPQFPGAPRERGDVCPGAVLALDGAPHRLDTRDFVNRADYLSPCAPTSLTGRVDAVLSYTLPSLRDVALELSAPGPGELSVDVSDTCGARTEARCAVGNPARLLLRRQPPGTYFVTVSYAGAPGRTLSATARSADPVPAHPADRCPGVAASSSSAFTIPMAGLGPHTAVACLGGARADAFFEHIAPPAGHDLVAVARSTRGAVALSLRERCAEPVDLACARGSSMAWRRFADLAPGARYTLVAGTSEVEGTLTVDTFEAPTSALVEARGNTTCAQATRAHAAGGRYAGDTLGGSWGGAALCGGLVCVGGRTVWFSFQLDARARLLAEAVGEGFAPVLSVYGGDGCPGRLVPGGCGDGGSTARLDVTLDPGRYRIALAGCGPGASGRYTLDWVTGPPDTRR